MNSDSPRSRTPTPLRDVLLRAVRFLHRHTTWLNGLKRSLGLERLAVSMVTPPPGSAELAEIARPANTTFVRDQIEKFRARGIENPDVYILAAEAMGDVLSCEPVGRAVRQLAPRCRIHWIVRDAFREIIAAAPFIDEVISVGTLSEGYDIFLEKTRNGAAVAVNCHMDGVACTKTGRVIRNPCNPRVNFFTYYNLGTLLNAFSRCAGLPMLEEASVFHFAQGVASPVPSDGPYVVFHCRSTDPKRDWTDEKWNRLAELVLGKGLGVIEIGMPRTIRSNSPRYIDFTGRRSLQQVARVIQGARLFVGVDSGFAHVACALRTPGTILLGRYAHYDTYMPYSGDFAHGDAFRILRAPGHAPAAELPLEDVAAVVMHLTGGPETARA